MPAAAVNANEVELLREEVAALRAQIAWLKQQLFGPGKSEKLDRAQLLLKLSELEKLAGTAERPVETITYERAKGPKEPRRVPAETFAKLPVVETIEIVPDEVRQDPELYERIGEERTFEVDVIEPKLVKREFVRPKFRHKLDRSRPPLIALAPARPVSGGYASAGLLAWIAISKYVHHLPLYRLEQMSQRWGAQISRRTMSDWIEVTAEWLAPIYRHMHGRLLAGDYLQADETPVRCNDPDEKRGGTTQGYLWVSADLGPMSSSTGGSHAATANSLHCSKASKACSNPTPTKLTPATSARTPALRGSVAGRMPDATSSRRWPSGPRPSNWCCV